LRSRKSETWWRHRKKALLLFAWWRGRWRDNGVLLADLQLASEAHGDDE